MEFFKWLWQWRVTLGAVVRVMFPQNTWIGEHVRGCAIQGMDNEYEIKAQDFNKVKSKCLVRNLEISNVSNKRAQWKKNI